MGESQQLADALQQEDRRGSRRLQQQQQHQQQQGSAAAQHHQRDLAENLGKLSMTHRGERDTTHVMLRLIQGQRASVAQAEQQQERTPAGRAAPRSPSAPRPRPSLPSNGYEGRAGRAASSGVRHRRARSVAPQCPPSPFAAPTVQSQVVPPEPVRAEQRAALKKSSPSNPFAKPSNPFAKPSNRSTTPATPPPQPPQHSTVASGSPAGGPGRHRPPAPQGATWYSHDPQHNKWVATPHPLAHSGAGEAPQGLAQAVCQQHLASPSQHFLKQEHRGGPTAKALPPPHAKWTDSSDLARVLGSTHKGDSSSDGDEGEALAPGGTGRCRRGRTWWRTVLLCGCVKA